MEQLRPSVCEKKLVCKRAILIPPSIKYLFYRIIDDRLMQQTCHMTADPPICSQFAFGPAVVIPADF
jgi:hypothetical protein